MRAYYKGMSGPKPEGILYHYTSQASLFNIVNNKSIWASHISYMNDSNEIKYAASRTIELIDWKSKSYNDEKLILLNQLSTWLEIYLKGLHFIFSFSLSEEPNLLSQWRAYTPKNSGVSIGFNQEDLENYCTNNELKLIKCIYDQTTQDKTLISTIDKILQDFDKDFCNINKSLGANTQEYYPFFQNYTEFFLYEFSKIKDPLFSEEKEWRILSKYYDSYTHTGIKFRSGKTTLIPYIELSLENLREDGKLFEQVYIGPSSNFELSYWAIVAFLSNKNACNKTINSLQTIREI